MRASKSSASSSSRTARRCRRRRRRRSAAGQRSGCGSPPSTHAARDRTRRRCRRQPWAERGRTRPAAAARSRCRAAVRQRRGRCRRRDRCSTSRSGILPAMAAEKAQPVIIEVCGREVRVSNPGKLFFPDVGLTKLDLVNYYVECETGGRAPSARAPDRDEALGRRRGGRAVLPEARARQRARVAADGDRHLPQRPPRARARRQRRRAPGVGRQPRRDRLEPVARAARRPRPSRRAARRPRPRARRAVLGGARGRARRARGARRSTACAAIPKTSGSRGIHIYVRIEPRESFEEVRRAALALAREVERRMPGRATSRWWKEEREGVFIDYNQNARDRTVASAYSVRAVPDARVSCPLEWDEVADVEPAELRLRPCLRACASAATRPRASTSTPAASTAARAGRPRRARGPRRRAMAAALPQAEGRAASACSPAARAPASRRRVSLPLQPRSSPSWRSRARSCPPARSTCTRSSSTAFAASRSSTASERVPAVAQRQAARALLPRAAASAGPLRARRRDRRARRRRARGLRRARPAHPPGGLARSSASRGRRRRCTSRSTCSRTRTTRCWSCLSPSAAPRSSGLLDGEAFARARRSS